MRMRLRNAFVALCAAGLPWADSYPRQAGIDVQHYAMHVTLHDETDAIEGETAITVKFVKDGVREVGLDLANEKDGKGMTVDGVVGAASYKHRDDRLVLTLAAPPRLGEAATF